MKLPNAENAFVDINKIVGYSLSDTHPTGKHKARVFRSVLGMTAADADELLVALLAAARNDEAVLGEADEHGQRWLVDFRLRRGDASATIRSAWIIQADENFARLTSCYVL